jgi:hypothetical protein
LSSGSLGCRSGKGGGFGRRPRTLGWYAFFGIAAHAGHFVAIFGGGYMSTTTLVTFWIGHQNTMVSVWFACFIGTADNRLTGCFVSAAIPTPAEVVVDVVVGMAETQVPGTPRTNYIDMVRSEVAILVATPAAAWTVSSVQTRSAQPVQALVVTLPTFLSLVILVVRVGVGMGARWATFNGSILPTVHHCVVVLVVLATIGFTQPSEQESPDESVKQAVHMTYRRVRNIERIHIRVIKVGGIAQLLRRPAPHVLHSQSSKKAREGCKVRNLRRKVDQQPFSKGLFELWLPW